MPYCNCLALIIGTLFCSVSATAQDVDRTGIEYFISEVVHDTLAVHITEQRVETPGKQFFFLWCTYDGLERGLSVIEAPGTTCDAPRLEATARFIVIDSERFAIISDDDNFHSVSHRVPDPRDPRRETAVSCISMHHWPYTIRFGPGGLLDASYEGIISE